VRRKIFGSLALALAITVTIHASILKSGINCDKLCVGHLVTETTGVCAWPTITEGGLYNKQNWGQRFRRNSGQY